MQDRPAGTGLVQDRPAGTGLVRDRPAGTGLVRDRPAGTGLVRDRPADAAGQVIAGTQKAVASRDVTGRDLTSKDVSRRDVTSKDILARSGQAGTGSDLPMRCGRLRRICACRRLGKTRKRLGETAFRGPCGRLRHQPGGPWSLAAGGCRRDLRLRCRL